MSAIQQYHQHLSNLDWPVKFVTLNLAEIEWPTVPSIDKITVDQIESGYDSYYSTCLDIPKMAKFRRLSWEFADSKQLSKVVFREMPQLIKINPSWKFNLDYDIGYGCQRMNWAKVWGFNTVDAIVHDVNDLLVGQDCKSIDKILAFYDQSIHNQMQFCLHNFNGYSWPGLQLLSNYAKEACKQLHNGYIFNNINQFELELSAEFTCDEQSMIKLLVSNEYSETSGHGWRAINKLGKDLPKKFFNFPARLNDK